MSNGAQLKVSTGHGPWLVTVGSQRGVAAEGLPQRGEPGLPEPGDRDRLPPAGGGLG
jgi:hypothetical protein